MKSTGPNGFTGEFQQTLEEEILPILHYLFQKIKAKEGLPDSFYVVTITLIPKPDKSIQTTIS